MTSRRYQKIQQRDETLTLNGSTISMPPLTNRHLFEDSDDGLEDDDDKQVPIGDELDTGIQFCKRVACVKVLFYNIPANRAPALPGKNLMSLGYTNFSLP